MGSTQNISKFTVSEWRCRLSIGLLSFSLRHLLLSWLWIMIWATGCGVFAEVAGATEQGDRWGGSQGPSAEGTEATTTRAPGAIRFSPEAEAIAQPHQPIGGEGFSAKSLNLPEGQESATGGLFSGAAKAALPRPLDTPKTVVQPAAIAAPATPVVDDANPEVLSRSPSSRRSPQVASKAEGVEGVDSRTAQDLLMPPTPTIAPAAAPEPQWAISSTVVSSLAQGDGPDAALPPPQPLPAQDKRFFPLPVDSLSPGLFRPGPTPLAADPGNPTPLPVPPECPNFDPELGCLRLQDPTFPMMPTAKAPVLYLLPRIDFFQSDNVLLGIEPLDDGLVRPSIGLLALPPIGPRTFIVASVDGAFSRYFQVPEYNYDELRIRAGIFHQLSPSMWGEIGWTNQQLFISGNEIPGFSSGTRFLNDHGLRLELSRRDQLAKRLTLNSVYQLRVSFADPEERSRILHVLYLSLNYDLMKAVQLGLDYQLAATNYTVVPRTDIYHQLLGRVAWTVARNVQTSVYGGISFGSSTEPGIDFNSVVLGVSLSLNLAIF